MRRLRILQGVCPRLTDGMVHRGDVIGSDGVRNALGALQEGGCVWDPEESLALVDAVPWGGGGGGDQHPHAPVLS